MKKSSCSPKKRLLLTLSALISALLFFLLYLLLVVNPLLLRVCSATVESNVIDVFQQTLVTELAGVRYRDLFTVERNDAGEIIAMHYDTMEVGKLAYRAAATIRETVPERMQSVEVPWGVFTGIAALSSIGSGVALPVRSIDAVSASVGSDFHSMAINQTLHRIYLKIHSSIQLVVPLRTKDMIVTHELLIGESLIVGEVPDTFLMDLDQDKMLDLIPG